MINELRYIDEEALEKKELYVGEVIGVGSEGCVHDFYNKINSFIESKGKEKLNKLRYRLITPRIPLKHMNQVVKKIDEFIKIFDVMSIVINDYGLLYQFNKLNIKHINIILGRTLIRTMADNPWYKLITENEKEGIREEIVQPNILHFEKVELFKAYGVRGIELSPIKENREAIIKLHDYDIFSFVHFDSEIATIGRTCPYVRMLNKSTYECKENCNKVINIEFEKTYGITPARDTNNKKLLKFPQFLGVGNVVFHRKNIDLAFPYEKSAGIIFNYILDDIDQIERTRKLFL